MEQSIMNPSLSGSMASSSPNSTTTNVSPKDSGPAQTIGDSLRNSSLSATNTRHPAPDPQTHLRSCITCRRRKIRCNKLHPCSNCVKAKVECVFPEPGRAPRRSKKATESELLARLKSLEAVVKKFGVVGKSSPVQSPVETMKEDVIKNGWDITMFKDLSSKDSELGSMDEELGRLVVSDDKSRYVSHRFWTRFGDEVIRVSLLCRCTFSKCELTK